MRIAIISFFILVLELALIRQIPAEVRSISYFTNLILMASLFGLGLGCILSRSRNFIYLLPVGLFLIAAFIYIARGIIIYEETISVHFWLQYTNLPEQAIHLPLFLAAITVFVLTAVPFVALGQNLALNMDKYPRLVAYSYDIAGSLAGVILFYFSSYFEAPPWFWIPAGVILWSYFLIEKKGLRFVNILASLFFLLFASSSIEWDWSPYYFIQHQTDKTGTYVWVNSSFHQLAVNFINNDPDKRETLKKMEDKFSFPYEVYRQYHNGENPERVLILGAGTGNDLVIAQRNGAKEIIAVEIDPLIVELGRKYNTSRPYELPNLEIVIDDARHFVRNCREKFDLVVLGTLDSQTLLSGQANLRLENYVYTEESFRDIKNILKSGGLAASYYSIFKPWLYGRIYSTVSSAFGPDTRLYKMDTPYLFNAIVIGAKELDGFKSDIGLAPEDSGIIPASDDWPFLYIEKPMLPGIYLKVVGLISLFILSVFIYVRKKYKLLAGLKANFLFLGIGFTLIEAAAIVRLALLFGNTWVINGFVFAGVLATIFLANFSVLKRTFISLRLAWTGLLIGILLNYFFPVSVFLNFNFWTRVIMSIIIIGIPVFFAALCFSQLFKGERFTGYALGMNLTGAMLGGMLEYSSMLWGMRNVWLLALAIYLSAYLTTYLNFKRKLK